MDSVDTAGPKHRFTYEERGWSHSFGTEERFPERYALYWGAAACAGRILCKKNQTRRFDNLKTETPDSWNPAGFSFEETGFITDTADWAD